MLLDDYILTQFIGKGTFGEVYLTKKKILIYYLQLKGCLKILLRIQNILNILKMKF